ncbi:MAG: OmpA family protein [Spirochaetales bacterium]|nr:OmpA family protein [Spirochaetales bacterium]
MGALKSWGIVLLALMVTGHASADVLRWRANSGQQYESKNTVKESVIGLDSITAKPALVTVNVLYQEEAAKNQSTVAHLASLPSFPRSSVEPGSTWTLPATVTYDLKAFGLTEPLTLEVPVNYRLVEIAEIDGKSYHHIKAEWYPFHVFENKIAKRIEIARLSGASSLDLLWDNRSGSPKKASITEETQYRFIDTTSLLYRREGLEEFKTVTDIVRERIIKQLTEQIASQKVANVEVRQSNEGIVLSVENIQFEAESATLAEAEKTKIAGISRVLASVKDRKLSVIGHAANVAGSNQDDLLALSRSRAEAVAEYLVSSGSRTSGSIVASGMGGSKPLASNDTPEGRSKNRRVEIVILDQETAE